MVLSQVDRMSAVILAKTIANTHSLLDMKGGSIVTGKQIGRAHV